MRRTVVRLPGKKSAPLWDDIGVCGEVYAEAIKDLIADVTELAAGTTDGWIAEYPKARAAIWYTLSEEERAAIETIRKTWNRTGLPKLVKKK